MTRPMTVPSARVIHADCLSALRDMPDASVDAIVTDPPYGLSNTTPAQVADTITRWVSGDREYLPTSVGFMGHEWDGFVPPVAVWDECLRVLKPGGHLLAFAGSRTQDLMGLAVRLAGFEIRDSVAWLYGSGFPKSMDVSKAIDRAAGAEREAIGPRVYAGGHVQRSSADKLAPPIGTFKRTQDDRVETEPATDAARQWEGWGTALKPAHEPIILARKPLDGTVAANVQEHGTGALNIRASRIGDEVRHAAFTSLAPAAGNRLGAHGTQEARRGTQGEAKEYVGRWPANVVLDESQAAELDRQVGPVHWQATNNTRKSSGWGVSEGKARRQWDAPKVGAERLAKEGPGLGPSKFFYVAKAPKSERPVVDGIAHPTVKPLTLMRWLVRMVTPPGGTVLDPFAGSGTTLEAAMMEGFNAVGIEREADYLPLIRARIERATTTLAAQAEAEGDTLFPIDGPAS